jgi:hypothetical protein
VKVKATEVKSERVSLPKLAGMPYQFLLLALHQALQPRTYLEIGTLHGDTLRMSEAASLAIDPEFKLRDDVLGSKPLCALYQTTSDRFFAKRRAADILGGPVELAFIDGMHRCEFLLRDFHYVEREARPNAVIAMHDVLPTELAMAERDDPGPGRAVDPDRSGWWTGDLWRTVLALKRFRPDLRVRVFDAEPTGLALITKLDSLSAVLRERYWEIVDAMMSWTIEEGGLRRYHDELPVESTAVLDSPQKITANFWL